MENIKLKDRVWREHFPGTTTCKCCMQRIPTHDVEEGVVVRLGVHTKMVEVKMPNGGYSWEWRKDLYPSEKEARIAFGIAANKERPTFCRNCMEYITANCQNCECRK